MKRNMRDIKLLVTEPDGRKVWRTFRGKPLVGTETFPMTVFAEMKSQGCWSVFQSASGKLVVYLRSTGSRRWTSEEQFPPEPTQA